MEDDFDAIACTHCNARINQIGLDEFHIPLYGNEILAPT